MVRDSKMSPAVGARVLLRAPEGGGWRKIREVRSGSDGVFRITGLLPGEYSLMLPESPDKAVRLEVAKGQTSHVQLISERAH
jgi:Carboxypeptidase regulatory-like domain